MQATKPVLQEVNRRMSESFEFRRGILKLAKSRWPDLVWRLRPDSVEPTLQVYHAQSGTWKGFSSEIPHKVMRNKVFDRQYKISLETMKELALSQDDYMLKTSSEWHPMCQRPLLMTTCTAKSGRVEE